MEWYGGRYGQKRWTGLLQVIRYILGAGQELVGIAFIEDPADDYQQIMILMPNSFAGSLPADWLPAAHHAVPAQAIGFHAQLHAL
jgi:hypothetical protein